MTKIEVRGGFHAVILIGKEDLIQIQLKDEVFIVAIGDFQGDQDFVDLALDSDIAVLQHQIASDLLGDGAGAGLNAAAADILDKGAGNRNRIEAGVFKETLVLLRDDSVNHVGADLRQRDRSAGAGLLAVDRSEQVAIGIEYAGGLILGRIVFQRGDARGRRVQPYRGTTS